jgi:hypothetical protein
MTAKAPTVTPARTAAGLTLEAAGQLVGYSAATMSDGRTADAKTGSSNELLRLAEAYGIPPDQLGLAASLPTAAQPTVRVSPGADNSGGDWMRRRNLLAGALGVTAAGALVPPAEANADSPATVEDVIFGRFTRTPLPDQQLAAQIAATKADFRACRYSQAARRRPRLLLQLPGILDDRGRSNPMARVAE